MKLSLLRREYLLLTVNVLKNSPNFLSITKRDFSELKLPSEWSINIVKMLSFRFQHCLIPCTMLFVQGFSEMRLFRHLSNNVFENPQFRKYIGYEGHLFFWKCAKCYLHFKITEKMAKSFCVLDNCIWNGCFNFSLLGRENLWPAVNVFTKYPKILHITKRNLFQLK